MVAILGISLVVCFSSLCRCTSYVCVAAFELWHRQFMTRQPTKYGCSCTIFIGQCKVTQAFQSLRHTICMSSSYLTIYMRRYLHRIRRSVRRTYRRESNQLHPSLSLSQQLLLQTDSDVSELRISGK